MFATPPNTLPPVPLVPPSLFGTYPSLPDLRNPHMSGYYFDRFRTGGLGDYNVRHARGNGLGMLIGGRDYLDADKLKKAHYR